MVLIRTYLTYVTLYMVGETHAKHWNIFSGQCSVTLDLNICIKLAVSIFPSSVYLKRPSRYKPVISYHTRICLACCPCVRDKKRLGNINGRGGHELLQQRQISRLHEFRPPVSDGGRQAKYLLGELKIVFFISQQKYASNPVGLYMTVKHCLNQEMKIVQQVECLLY